MRAFYFSNHGQAAGASHPPGNPRGNTIYAPLTKAAYAGMPIRTAVSATSLDPNNPNVRWSNCGTNAPFALAPSTTLASTSIFDNAFRNPWHRGENVSIVKTFAI